MCEENYKKLWVIKFCIKVVFPTYNLYLFLVFLAIRFRIFHHRQEVLKVKFTEAHLEMLKMHSVPMEFVSTLTSDSQKLHKSVDIHTYSNCLLVAQDIYKRMVIENPFYFDHKTVWTALKLAPKLRDKLKRAYSSDDANSLKYNLKQMTRIHKQLWSRNKHENYNNTRIVRIVGSEKVANDQIVVSEDEGFNIKSCFGLPLEDCELELHLRPVGSMEYVPKIATSAVVKMIVNPYDLSNDFVTELLSNYFKSPRLVHVGDLFSIELTPEMTTKYHYKYFDLADSTARLYFKCWGITRNGNETNHLYDGSNSNVQAPYFIVKGKTELNLAENIHCATPAHRYFTSGANIRCDPLMEFCPFGLRHNFSKIQDSILPFLVTRQGNPLHKPLVTPIMPIFLLSGAPGSGRHLLVKTIAKYNGINILVVDCHSIQSTTAKQTESKISSLIQRAKACSPAVVLMDNFEVFAVDAENNEDCRVLEYFCRITANLFENYTKHPIVLIAVSERVDLKPNIMRLFLEKFHVSKPTNSERYEMLKWYMQAMRIKLNESANSEENECSKIIDFIETSSKLGSRTKEILERISVKTETFLYGDLDTLVHFALRNNFMNHSSGNSVDESALEVLYEEDFSTALENMRALQSQHMDAPKIPKVYWEDIGGLDTLKKELLKTIEFPIKYPHLFKNPSLKRSGVLLYGPPGCGKTLVAKALSTEINVSFLSVKGPELLNMYIGQSEENVRKVFESARAASPCVVFLDELDALAPRRGATGDSGGASDRVVSQLLAEIDGVAQSGADSESSFVFIMGATNRPDLLEQSLLRPGRIDKLIYVGPYCGLDEKTRVLTALCHRRKLASDVSLPEIASALPARCTGADLMQVVSVARAAAVRRAVAALRDGSIREFDLDSNSIVLETADLYSGVAAYKPSTTDEEFAYYDKLKVQL